MKINSVCGGGHVCTACGCCIKQKATATESVCGLVELGKEPKWTAINADNPVDRRLKVICEDAKINVTQETPNIVLQRDYDKEQEKKVSFEVKFKHKDKVKPLSVIASCGCTASQTEIIDKRSFKVNVDVSTTRFKNDESNKALTVTYDVGVGTPKKFRLN
jgi:hypothetical protein